MNIDNIGREPLSHQKALDVVAQYKHIVWLIAQIAPDLVAEATEMADEEMFKRFKGSNVIPMMRKKA